MAPPLIFRRLFSRTTQHLSMVAAVEWTLSRTRIEIVEHAVKLRFSERKTCSDVLRASIEAKTDVIPETSRSLDTWCSYEIQETQNAFSMMWR